MGPRYASARHASWDSADTQSRKFWHLYLPRLKYHNPAVPMTVDFGGDQEGPASLTIFFSSPSSDSSTETPQTMSTSGDKAPSEGHDHFETTKSINMKHKHESKILDELMKLVSGKQVEATAEEQEELKELAEERARSDQDRVKQAAVLASRRRQAEILAQARQSVDAQTAS